MLLGLQQSGLKGAKSMKLYFEADSATGERNSSEINITKETRNFIYFTAGKFSIEYRCKKADGTVEYKWGNGWKMMDGYLK